MTELTLASIGLSEDQLAEKLVEKLAANVLTSLQYDEGSGEWYGESAFAKKLDAMVKQRLTEIVDKIASEHVLPMVGKMVEEVTFQQTNGYGEPKRPPQTFREYLADLAQKWMTEPVSYDGKVKGQDSFSWQPKTTRVGYMIGQYLHHHIEREMKEALGGVNAKIAEGLEAAVKLQPKQVLDNLKVNVSTGR